MRSCSDTLAEIEDFTRHRLAQAAATEVERHLTTCRSCTAEVERSRRAGDLLEVLRDDDVTADFSEAELRFQRTRILAAVREEIHARGASRWAFLPAFGFAGVTLALLGFAVLLGSPAGKSAAPVASAAIPAVADVDPDLVQVVTLATKDGVKVEWQGPAGTYQVIRSTRPASSAAATATVVCGRSWTDSERTVGLVTYQVVPLNEPCRS